MSNCKLAILGAILLAVGSMFAGTVAVKNSHQAAAPPQNTVAVKAENPIFKTPHSLRELLALSPDELKHCDIARMNLLCAGGLPGAEDLNVGECLTTLDQWANYIRWQIDRNFHQYQENPDYFYDSTNFYKVVMMASVLYSQFHIRYNPRLIESPSLTPPPDDDFFADSRDIFISGLLGPRRMGTCSSMPVLYVALGRRLGFPLKLVATKEHLFVRWDSPTERFDLDATEKGVNKYDDAYYKQWPFPISDKEIKAESYLQSMTPAQELSTFLSTRAACLHEAGRIRDELAAHAAALRLEPHWHRNQWMLQRAEREYTGISIAELENAQPESQDPEELARFDLWKQATLNRLERAECGAPEIGLPVYSKNPIP